MISKGKNTFPLQKQPESLKKLLLTLMDSKCHKQTAQAKTIHQSIVILLAKLKLLIISNFLPNR